MPGLFFPIPWEPQRVGLSYLEWYPNHKVWHPGVDFNWGPTPTSDIGKPIKMPTDGEIAYVSTHNQNNGGLGLYVVVYHRTHNVWTRYVHLQDVWVKIGQKVDRGVEFCTLGGSGGFSKTPHLHFEVLNSSGINHIKNHWRQPYNGYFSNLPKERVASMTIDPILWIENSEHEEKPTWQDEAREWAQKNKIIVSGWDSPNEPMSQVRIAAAMKNLDKLLSS